MSERRIDLLWRLLILIIADILNPLLLLSLGLFMSVGYICTLLIPVGISEWQTVLWSAVAASLTFLASRACIKWRQGQYLALKFSVRALLPILPLLIFLPIFHAELTTPILQIMHHGDLHVGYVHELLYRNTPIDNIFVSGHPANYYWLYHAMLAVFVKITSVAPPMVASTVSVVVITSSLIWLAQILVTLKLAEYRSLRLGLLVILVYCALNLTGALSLLGDILEGTFITDSLRVMLLSGADRRLHSVMGKVMNFTSMSFGIWCFLVVVHYCLRFFQGKLDRTGLVLCSAAIIVCLAVRQTGALYIGMVLLGGTMILTLVTGLGRQTTSNLVRSLYFDAFGVLGPRFLVGWGLTFSILVVALLDYFGTFSRANEVGLVVEAFNISNLAMMSAALLIFLPLCIVQIVFMLRIHSLLERFIQISCVAGFLTTWVIVLPDDGQYKTVYYLSILFSISGLLALRNISLCSGKRVQWAVRFATIALLVLAFAKVAFVKQYYDQRAIGWSVSYEDSHVVFHGGSVAPDYMEALVWIRDYAPTEAIVILPIKVHKFAHIVHERQVYVRESQVWYTDNISAYEQRVAHVARFYDRSLALYDYQETLEEMRTHMPGRALFAVIRSLDISHDGMKTRGAQRSFVNPNGGAHVYLLNPPTGG